MLLLGKAVLARVLEEWDVDLDEPSIDPSEPLPKMLDFYNIRLEVERRGD